MGAFVPVLTPVRSSVRVVCLHAHSCHSREDLAGLNWVVELGYMRPFRGVLQRAFGLGGVSDLDYRQLGYRPPFRPGDVWRMESESARRLEIDRLLIAITDHDEVAEARSSCGGAKPAEAERIALGEELTIGFDGPRLPPRPVWSAGGRASRTQASLRASACARPPRRDLRGARFARLPGRPESPVDHLGARRRRRSALDLLRRYGWAIAALRSTACARRGESARHRAGPARREAARRRG